MHRANQPTPRKQIVSVQKAARQDAAAQESTDDSRHEIEISVALTSRRCAWFMRRNAVAVASAVMGTWLQKSK